MTTIVLSEDADKGFFNDDLEKILQSFVDEDGICKICGNDHSPKVTLDGISITINQIHKLFKKEFLEDV
jgi:hypothetical protein